MKVKKMIVKTLAAFTMQTDNVQELMMMAYMESVGWLHLKENVNLKKIWRKSGMYYRADVYIDSNFRNSFIANSVEVLKVKAKPYIENEKVTQIVVSKVEDIGFFKIPAEIDKFIEKELLL